MAKRKFKKTYKYECSVTGEQFTTSQEAPHPEELLSIKAYYELHPEEDDRSEAIKKKLEQE